MKNIFPNILKSKNDIIKEKTGLSVYDCANKDSNCKGVGLVLEKGQKCFDCQYNGAPWLRADFNLPANPSQSLSQKRPSNLLINHRRSNSICISPTSVDSLTPKTEESEVDPYMFASPSLKRQGAILRTKKEENIDKKLLLISEDLAKTVSWAVEENKNHSFTTQSSETLLGKEKEVEVDDIGLSIVKEELTEGITNLSQDLVSSPLTNNLQIPTGEEWNSKVKNELISILKEVSCFTFSLTRDNLQALLPQMQKLRDENQFLRQQVRELKEYKLRSEEDRFQRLSSRQEGSEGGLPLEDVQEISRLCQEIVKLRDEVEKQRLEAQIEVLSHSKLN